MNQVAQVITLMMGIIDDHDTIRNRLFGYGNRYDCCMYFCNLQTFFLPTAITIPILIVVGSIASAGNQYNLRSFPPTRCFNGRANYFNFILPLNVMVLIANTLLVAIAWVIHKVS